MDITTLILAGSPFEDITAQELAQQIIGRQKATQKLPTWFSKMRIYYPPKLNLEQTSSEVTAFYKSNLVSGDTLIDLTGGFGIDDYFFSKTIKHVTHCEINEELSALARHNFKILETTNIVCEIGNGLDILKKIDTIDWIYIDPSRRNDSKGKVFFLEDCLPDVPGHLNFLFAKTSNLLIKTSPLLDITVGIRSLQYVKEVHVIAVSNEVKELLWVIEKEYLGDCKIKTVNISKKETQEFSFFLQEEAQKPPVLESPKTFLYEPNAAILKSGGFLSIGAYFKLKKLHQHTHLYTSDQKIDFPGRRFEIVNIFPYHKKNMARAGISKANITIRNFPESVVNIRKKHKINDGGQTYLFFTTDKDNKRIVLQCNKV